MGDPVTGRELDAWEREAAQETADGDSAWSPRTALRMIAEVRRLRDALKQADRTHAEGFTSGYDHGTADGYARAERDVAAWLRATAPKSRHATGHSSLSWAAKDIEQGAHRGAAGEGT